MTSGLKWIPSARRLSKCVRFFLAFLNSMAAAGVSAAPWSSAYWVGDTALTSKATFLPSIHSGMKMSAGRDWSPGIRIRDGISSTGWSRPLDFGAASSGAFRQGSRDVGRSQRKKQKKKRKKKKKKNKKKKKKKKKKKTKKKKKNDETIKAFFPKCLNNVMEF